MMRDALYALLSRPFGGVLAGVAVVLVALTLQRLTRGQRRFVRAGPWVLAVVGVLLTGGGLKGGLAQRHALAAVAPPGRLVDIGGFRLHLLAEGDAHGGATVVWIPGSHEQGNAMYHLHAAIRGETRSILFDRAGTGWSDPGPFPRRTRVEAEELATLLDRAGERGPFILAGHSYGGLLAANFARRYPDRTAGVILLDATPPDAFVYAPVFGASAAQGLVLLGRVEGLRRAFGLWSPPPSRRPPADPARSSVERARDVALAPVDAAMRAGRSRASDGFATASIFEEFTASVAGTEAPDLVVYDGELRGIPVFVVIPRGGADREIQAMRLPPAAERRAINFFRRSRQRYLAVSDRMELIHPPDGASHNYPYEYPEVVVAAARRALAVARGGAPPAPPPDTVRSAAPPPSP